jgi:transcriptional regulator with XRE-family HTH domain
MAPFASENLLRLMAAEGLSARGVAKRSGLHARTVQGIINGGRRPHARTLHHLARGLRVSVDEFFVDPAQLLSRRFDRQTNPLVAEIVADHRELFAGWAEADFDELHSRVGTGGAMTIEGALRAVGQMNRKRQLHDKLNLLLETSHAEIASGILDVLYEKAFASACRTDV